MSLHYAVQQNNLLSLVHLLKQGENPDIVIDDSRLTPLHNAVTLDRLDFAAILLAYGANPNALQHDSYTPLHSARSLKMAALLLRYNADLTVKNKFGKTSLHCAVSYWETAKLLLEHKADPNAIDNNGNTPLQIGVYSGLWETTRLLLLHKANVNVANKMRKTALFDAITRQNAPLVNLLLEHQASVNVSDFSGTTPLHKAVEFCPEVVETLLAHGAIVQVYNKARETPMTIAKFDSPLQRLLSKVEWRQTLMEFCKGLHPRLGQHSSIRRCWTSELSERHLIWLIGLFLKPSAE
jgi:uncharacterized protein